MGFSDHETRYLPIVTLKLLRRSEDNFEKKEITREVKYAKKQNKKKQQNALFWCASGFSLHDL